MVIDSGKNEQKVSLPSVERGQHSAIENHSPDWPALAEPISVSVFQRAAGPGRHSVERIVESLILHAPDSILLQRHRCPAADASPVSIMRNLVWAWSRRNVSDVNIVLGNDQYLAFGLPGARTILTVLDLDHRASLGRIKKAIYSWFWFRGPIARVARVVAISERTRADILRLGSCSAAKVEVIPVGLSEGVAMTPQRCGTGSKRVLHIGTKANKNFERHLRVAARAGATLVVVGELSPDQEAIVAASEGNVECRGEVLDAQLAAIYKSADALLFASTSEGFGMPIVEAQAAGVPVITSDLEPMRSVAGGGACLVDPLDEDSISQGLRRVLEDGSYRDQLTAQGPENVALYDPVRIARLYAALCASVGDRDAEAAGSAGQH
jgi:glycosyltransferase involved in cell wall biosynthesis